MTHRCKLPRCERVPTLVAGRQGRSNELDEVAVIFVDFDLSASPEVFDEPLAHPVEYPNDAPTGQPFIQECAVS